MLASISILTAGIRVRKTLLGAVILSTLLLAGCHRCPVLPSSIQVDWAGDGLLEPGKVTAVEPAWRYFIQSVNHRRLQCQPSALLPGSLEHSGPDGGLHRQELGPASVLIEESIPGLGAAGFFKKRRIS